MSGVTFIGNIIVDYIKMIDNFPAIGNLSNITAISRNIGGLAVNTPVGLKIMAPEFDILSMGMVGNDDNGRYVTKSLAAYGVDVSGISVHKSLPTSFTDVMTISSTRARTFFQAQGAGAAYGFDDINFESIRTDIAHVGYALLMDKFDRPDPDYGTQMAKIMAKLRSMGIQTSFDVVSENSERFTRIVTPSLRQADYVFMNEVESAGTVGIPTRGKDEKLLIHNIQKICARLMELGVHKMAAIHAPEGGWAMTADGDFYHEPALDLPQGFIKGTVGAGDAFCAGMLYSILKGKGPAFGLSIAGAAAACSLSAENSVDGMRPIAQVLELRNKLMHHIS